jgi:hypothetical protein
LLASPQAPVVAALDDPLCKKTGRHIPGASYARDPQSPAFHLNLCRGLRFVQASVLVRATQFLGPARALPVRFEPRVLYRAVKVRPFSLLDIVKAHMPAFRGSQHRESDVLVGRVVRSHRTIQQY